MTLVDDTGRTAILAVPRPASSSTPVKWRPRLKQGLGLHGIISGEDGITAYITVDGRIEPLKVGDVIQRQGYTVTVQEINTEKLTVTIADIRGRTETLYQLPPAPPLIKRPSR